LQNDTTAIANILRHPSPGCCCFLIITDVHRWHGNGWGFKQHCWYCPIIL